MNLDSTTSCKGNLLLTKMLNLIRTEPLTQSEERLTAEWEFVGLFLRARPIFYVFTVTLSNVRMQTSQYRMFRIWETKEDKYTKSLAKNQICGIIRMRDIRKNVLPKFIRLCMETPCWCPFEGHKYGRRKPTETSVFEFSYLCVNSSLEELIKIKVIFILR